MKLSFDFDITEGAIEHYGILKVPYLLARADLI